MKRNVFLLMGLLLCGDRVLADELDALMQMDLAQLMQIKVTAVSKYEQAAQDAPASVTVITREQIETFGWRHLSDLLRAQRGIYTSYDRIYGYLGVRGALVSGDLNSRLLLTIDGYRASDVVYQQGFILNDFLLNTDLIERVELIRGAGSSIHGASALFAVINIVTRQPIGEPRHQVATMLGSGQQRSFSYSFSGQLNADTRLLLSLDGLSSDGEPLFFNEPGRFVGYSHDKDSEQVRRLFAHLQYQDWRMMLAWVERNKGIATGATGALFDQSDNRYIDTQTAFNLSRQWNLGSAQKIETRVYAGDYDFDGYLLYQQPAGLVANRDLAQGRWYGTEWKLITQRPERRRILGFEYQRNTRQHQQNYDVNGASYLDYPKHSRAYGLYWQEEWDYQSQHSLSLGARYDVDYLAHRHVSPRFAWLYRPSVQQNIKLLASQAYRSPNVGELYYEFGGFSGNADLRSEVMRSLELVYEHQLSSAFVYTLNPYRNRLSRRISQQTLANGNVQYQNKGEALIDGLELEMAYQVNPQQEWRASYSWQRARDELGHTLIDSPQQMATLNYRLLLPILRGKLGLEYLYNGPRSTFRHQQTEPIHLFNLNLSGVQQGWQWSVLVQNLMDRSYATPDTPDPQLTRDRIEQDGRSWQAKLKWFF